MLRLKTKANRIAKGKTMQTVYTGTVEYWGEKWEGYWWTLDFSEVRQEGSYFIRFGGEESSVFEIDDMVFTEAELAMVALDQLDDRLVTWSNTQGHSVTIYHGCAARVTAELQAVGNVVHALADMYDNKAIFEALSPAYQQKLLDHLMLGADYLVDSQLNSIDPVEFSDPLVKGTHIHSWVSIVYYDIAKTAFKGQVFNGWQDMALAMTGLSRAAAVLNDAGGYSTKVTGYLGSADVSFECAMARPYYIESKQAIMTTQTDPALDVGTYYLQIYDRSEAKGWLPPTDLRVRDMLPFVWACTMLHEQTGQQKYLDRAIEYADKIAALQFTDWENPIDGTFGTFYAFPNDTTSMMLEHHQFHGWNLGATTPANMAGLINLIELAPDHSNVATWYNTVKTYADQYVKKSGALSPFKIYPFSTYTDPVYGGVKFFQSYAHGSMGGHYGAMGKHIMYLADFLNDSSYQELANNNVNFVVGLNSGFPTEYVEYEWDAISLIKGVGVNYFDRPGIGNGTDERIQQYAQAGSGFNGFSAFPQFLTGFISEAPDAPGGILKPDGSYHFNEDWLVHSHAYVSGVAALEGDYVLNISANYDGTPVVAAVQVSLTELAPPNAALTYNYTTDTNGQVIVSTLPVQTEGTVSVTYNDTTVSRHIEPAASGSYSFDIDFADYVVASIDTPAILNTSQSGTLEITLTNHGDQPTTADVTLSADGVVLGSNGLSEPLAAGQSKVITISITAGTQVKPYLVHALVTSGNNEQTVVADGKIGSQAVTGQAPSFTADPVIEVYATEITPYSSTLADDAADPQGDPMTFWKVAGPAWLKVAADGTLSGTLDVGDVGLGVLTVQVDAAGGSDRATIQIEVVGSPPYMVDHFDGPTLDPAWTVLGTAGTFTSGIYRISHTGSGQNGLSRTVGSGDITSVVELDNLSFSGTVDTTFRYIDESGYMLIVQVVDGGLNCGVWNGSDYLPQVTDVPLAGVTDLNLRFTWTDEPGLGGSWLIEYDANDAGYQSLVTIPASVYLSDASSGRTFELWMEGAGTGMIDVDRFALYGFPGNQIAIDGIERSGTHVILRWQSVTNAEYSVDYCTDLTHVFWIPLVIDVPATPLEVSYPADITADRQRFYRVRERRTQ